MMTSKSVFREFREGNAQKPHPETIQQLKDMYRDVAIVFDNERGRRVLNYIKEEFHHGRLATDNPTETTVRAAQRDVIDTLHYWIMQGRGQLMEDSDRAEDT
jgi:hypothetical protein